MSTKLTVGAAVGISCVVIYHLYQSIWNIQSKFLPKNNDKANILVCIADGSEDIETVTIIDVLRRTQKVNLTVATVGGKNEITASRKTKFIGDCKIEDIAKNNKQFNMICLPGGMPGATNLYNDKILLSILKNHLNKIQNFILGAICASPSIVLSQYGILKGLPATSYPVEKFINILKNNKAKYQDGSVVIA